MESDSVNTTSYKNIHNYGYISSYVYLSQNETQNTNIVNYGIMGGVSGYNNNKNKPITIDNRGTINLFKNNNGKKVHFTMLKSLTLQNYAMMIKESASKFNSFDGNATDNSHLVLDSVTSVSFADANAKMILDFGGDFEVGKGYALSKLIVDATNGSNKLSVEFSRLVPRSDLFSLSQSGNYFIATLNTNASTIGNLYKSNIRTMNNFYLMSNAMIYPRKAQNLTSSSLRDSELDSTNHLKSYESFAYRNEAINRRIQRQNKRNYSRESLKSQNLESSSLRADSQNLRGNPKDLQALRSNHPNNSLRDSANHDYYFILTPFVNYNSFAESGRYNLSGFDCGFLTAFSAKVAESNSLGTHFMMSYGTLGDKKDKDFMIKTLNLNLGLNYKLDLIWDMFLKARGDFFYFLNQAKTLTMIEAIKPNNLGFGASVTYGKEWDFKSGGVLGIEAGLDYKALQSSMISLQNNATKTISETYQKSLYNLIYVDLGLNYAKYFGNFGLNTGLGIRGNITANKLAKSQIRINNLNRNVDMVLDNDMFLGYANISASYVLNAKDFDMEFSLAYYGNFGDRVISNGGGVEWRVFW